MFVNAIVTLGVRERYEDQESQNTEGDKALPSAARAHEAGKMAGQLLLSQWGGPGIFGGAGEGT